MELGALYGPCVIIANLYSFGKPNPSHNQVPPQQVHPVLPTMDMRMRMTMIMTMGMESARTRIPTHIRTPIHTLTLTLPPTPTPTTPTSEPTTVQSTRPKRPQTSDKNLEDYQVVLSGV